MSEREFKGKCFGVRLQRRGGPGEPEGECHACRDTTGYRQREWSAEHGWHHVLIPSSEDAYCISCTAIHKAERWEPEGEVPCCAHDAASHSASKCYGTFVGGGWLYDCNCKGKPPSASEESPRENRSLGVKNDSAEPSEGEVPPPSIAMQWANLHAEAQQKLRAAESALADRTEERDKYAQRLAEAAQEINCAGPVAHRIRVLKREHADALASMKAERDGLRTLVQDVARAIRGLAPVTDEARSVLGNVLDDLSAARQEREKLEKALRDLIETPMGLSHEQISARDAGRAVLAALRSTVAPPVKCMCGGGKVVHRSDAPCYLEAPVAPETEKEKP